LRSLDFGATLSLAFGVLFREADSREIFVERLLLEGASDFVAAFAFVEDLLDCPIASAGLTHIITMMRESAINARFFMTVILFGLNFDLHNVKNLTKTIFFTTFDAVKLNNTHG